MDSKERTVSETAEPTVGRRARDKGFLGLPADGWLSFLTKGRRACCQALRWSARPVRSAKSCGRCWSSTRSPSARIKFLASERSAGKTIDFKGKQYPVEPIRPEAFAGVDIVLSSTPASVSREYSPMAARAGAIVIDNSSAWRMDPEVPLVVPEVNADALRAHSQGHRRQSQLLDDPDGRRPEAAARPGAGSSASSCRPIRRRPARGPRGCSSWTRQLAAVGRGEPVPPATAHAAQLAGNVLPHDWKAGEDGYSEEEWKMIRETRKIMGDDTHPGVADDGARAGAHRPFRGDQPRVPQADHASSRRARRCAQAPGIILLDDYAKGEVPLPLALRGPRRGVRRPDPPRSDRCRTASTCGSSPTTCARGRPPTRCRSPRCWCSAAGCRRKSNRAGG